MECWVLICQEYGSNFRTVLGVFSSADLAYEGIDKRSSVYKKTSFKYKAFKCSLDSFDDVTRLWGVETLHD